MTDLAQCSYLNGHTAAQVTEMCAQLHHVLFNHGMNRYAKSVRALGLARQTISELFKRRICFQVRPPFCVAYQVSSSSFVFSFCDAKSQASYTLSVGLNI